MLFSANPSGKSWDIMRLAMPNGSSLEKWRATEFNERNPRFSPDGNWVAYESDETGSYQIHLRSFPGGTVSRRVTTDGGFWPVWSRDGKEVFYVNPRGHVMAIPIRTGPALDAGEPRDAFPTGNSLRLGRWDYDVDPKGLFLLNILDGPPESYTASLVLNWPKLVKR